MITVPKGTLVGNCPNCGYVLEDDIQDRLPAPAICDRCGEKLDDVRINDRERTVSSEEVA